MYSWKNHDTVETSGCTAFRKLAIMIFKILVSIFHFNIFISKSIKRLMTTCRVVARQRRGEKVMFSQVYVCPRGVAYLWCQVPSWFLVPCLFRGVESLWLHIPLEVRWGRYALPLGYPTTPRYPTSLSYPTFPGYPTPSQKGHWTRDTLTPQKGYGTRDI